jgi:hypothetical protein
MNFQRSTDAEETPTADSESLRDVLDSPIDVPRVRDTDAEEERSLENHRAMKSAEVGPEMVKAILLGLSPTVVETGNRETTGRLPASLSTGSA